MDVGCYPVHMVRTVAGTEPEVTSAVSATGWGGVDRATSAELRFPAGPGPGSGSGEGLTGAITCSMWSHRLAAIWLRVEGTEGTLKVRNPLMPHLFGQIKVTAGGRTRRERHWSGTTYSYQLAAFVAAVRDGAPFPTGVDDAVANMAVIDAVYRAAGREPNRPTP